MLLLLLLVSVVNSISPLAAVVMLLAAIVLLLCEPQALRFGALRRMAGIGCILYLAHYVLPIALGLLIIAAESVLHHPMQFTIAGGALFFLFLTLLLGRLALLDAKDNRAIKAGSVQAFDQRVKELETSFDYGHDQAVEATMRIKDGH